MKKLRQIPEAEVIAGFLKNEYYQEEFHSDRTQFESVVIQPDTTNTAQNALRRALLFRRRGHLWREIPAGTQWHEVQLEDCDLKRVRVFPRHPWWAITLGGFQLERIAERIRNGRASHLPQFMTKIHSLGYHMRMEPRRSTVVLIGVDETLPLTILEGNHRLTAAMLVSRTLIGERFQVICGFSPQMRHCCWYATTPAALVRYLTHRLQNLFYDPEADLARVLVPEAVGGLVQPASELPQALKGDAMLRQ